MDIKNLHNQDYPGGFNEPPTQLIPPIPPPPPPPPYGSEYTGGSGYTGLNDQNEQIIISMAKNMKFIGIWHIILGVLYCLSCVGAVIGIPIIFMGIRLRESAESFLSYVSSKMSDSSILMFALQKQSRYFHIIKILIIIGIVLICLEIIFLIVMFIVMPTTFKRFSY
jgi:hypothetical protein